jgi:osmotically-inducible protein OsmY
MRRLKTRLGLWAAALVLASAGASLAAAPPDAWITTKTKLALITSDNVSSSNVNVDTTNGQVTLHGKVASATEKAEAERLAKGIDGVKSVRNMLQVVTEPRADSVKVADDNLKDRVEKALKADSTLADSDIAVASVNDGVVLLKGEARTIGDHLRAVETTARVPGVRRVASEIQSPDKVGDAEIHRDRDADEGRTAEAKESMSDGYITSATKLKLMADSRVPGLDVNVDTYGSEVTLFGMVPTKEAKAAAGEIAKSVSGVKAVKNELQVVPEKRQDVVQATDGDIAKRVENAIGQTDSLKDSDIKVEVSNGVARLTGTVERPEQRMTAAVVAREAAGVKAVKEELRVASK